MRGKSRGMKMTKEHKRAISMAIVGVHIFVGCCILAIWNLYFFKYSALKRIIIVSGTLGASICIGNLRAKIDFKKNPPDEITCKLYCILENREKGVEDIIQYLLERDKPLKHENKNEKKKRQKKNIIKLQLLLKQHMSSYEMFKRVVSVIGVIGTVFLTGNIFINLEEAVKTSVIVLFLGCFEFVACFGKLWLYEYPKLNQLVEIEKIMSTPEKLKLLKK